MVRECPSSLRRDGILGAQASGPDAAHVEASAAQRRKRCVACGLLSVAGPQRIEGRTVSEVRQKHCGTSRGASVVAAL
jgi:hypothetical protein